MVSPDVFMRRLENAKTFEEEDRRIAAVQMANSPQAQLVKRRSEETGESFYIVALDMAKELKESINATSSIDERANA